MAGLSFMGSANRIGWNVFSMANREIDEVYPVTLYEPVTKLELFAGMMVVSNHGDSGIEVTFHNILIPPKDLLAATRPMTGMILLPKHETDGTAFMVTQDMKKVGEGWCWNARKWYVFGYLTVKPVRNPLDISEIIETENVKLLEK